jgi:hypothetical protein
MLMIDDEIIFTCLYLLVVVDCVVTNLLSILRLNFPNFVANLHGFQ